ncbi:glycoside hydrolase domain-containing protein [Nocardioides sp. C4-1]|uniref:glycoside hydrolase domain-containing protein n=1 Tax=Nocardioides sp. C4-1 TaxID=3151851 RepID=UPI0032634806
MSYVAGRLVVLLALVAGLLAAGPTSAQAARPTPGGFTGYAFDARCAPTQAQMNAWLTSSPFLGAGIYIGGSTMSCRTEQSHLDATWVRRQSVAGWRLLPIWVGPQASCSDYADRIDDAPASSYAAAGTQGRTQAAAAVRRARALGIAPASTLWYDLEGGFDVADDLCRRSALRFLSGWTAQVKRSGYRSGVYSSIADGIHALDYAALASPGSYTMPDQVWFAWANGRADVAFDPAKVRGSSWVRQRVHQYVLDRPATYGGVTLTIDRNYAVVGGGSVAPPAKRACGGRAVLDRADYPGLRPGRRGDAVRTAQCLLKQRGAYRGTVDGRYDKPVAAAVRKHQRSRGLPATGRVDRRTWTTLLSAGARPLLKEGSAGDAVRRLQRALNVATASDAKVTGVFSAGTTRWVKAYQARLRLPATGVVTSAVWAALSRGRV